MKYYSKQQKEIPEAHNTDEFLKHCVEWKKLYTKVILYTKEYIKYILTIPFL